MPSDDVNADKIKRARKYSLISAVVGFAVFLAVFAVVSTQLPDLWHAYQWQITIGTIVVVYVVRRFGSRWFLARQRR
jgi:peptidoglycan/LPS O-acetylase OafA/YrhL